ncbi:MAG TPA: GDP-mannose 4,6-dehydratase [Candidatus Krumholzibacteria bacterium]|nr:GDP-mannose 4,6-dehydratase [Candidatus Krumholzibacteria bacterium]HPD72283.1 GDP-mannose 4,6-dehydratase [Candidatus Krumholzibacteria bacterium]HRY40785.1 GDP-mannose 4,6-dehydratase [Candidatus Krumholzibacteria bacterium]
MNDLSSIRVLVTGGAGFIPSHLVDLLVARGARVTVLDDLSAGTRENLARVAGAIEFVEGSVADRDLVDRVVAGQEWVFNFAANADVPRSVKHPDTDFTSNALGAHHVFDACRRHGVGRVVQASTAAVYGEPRYTPMDEEHPLRPISPYGASKLGAEALGFAYHHTYGLPFTALRIFNTYGPRQPRYVIYDLFRKLERDRRRLEVLGTGEQVRDYCYVADTATAFLAVAGDEGTIGEVYNIAGGQPVSIRELVALILETLGLADTEPYYTGQSWPGDISRLVADVTRLRARGFAPTVDLREGLRRFAEWIDIAPGEGAR